MLVKGDDRDIQSLEELEWRLQRTNSLDNITCDEKAQDFRNCSFFMRQGEAGYAMQLVLVCNPRPGKFESWQKGQKCFGDVLD